MTLRPRSLRSRLVLSAVGVTLAFAVVFAVISVWTIHRAEEQTVRAALKSRLELVRDSMTADGSLTGAGANPKTGLVQVVGPDGLVRSSSPALRAVPALLRTVPLATHGRADVALQTPDVDLALLGESVDLTARGSSPAGSGVLVVAVDTEGMGAATAQLFGVLASALLALLGAVAVLGWIITGRALRTVARITESAESVGPGDLAAGLPVPRRDTELARLVGALNRMLARLGSVHQAELTFAADAGHRLRTPIATLRAEAELALLEPDPAERTAALGRIVSDADQLAAVVDQMLARSRARTRPPQALGDVLQLVESRWQRQARLAEVRLEVRVSSAVEPTDVCRGLVEVLEPVLDNAVRHAGARGAVVVSVDVVPPDVAGVVERAGPARRGGLPARRAGPWVVVDVSNDGAGIARGLREHLFEVWASSRDATVAGGLGLWVARETARDQGGDVALLDPGPGRTVFRVVLPLGDEARPRPTSSWTDDTRRPG